VISTYFDRLQFAQFCKIKLWLTSKLHPSPFGEGGRRKAAGWGPLDA
jgi:hypothetical protein